MRRLGATLLMLLACSLSLAQTSRDVIRVVEDDQAPIVDRACDPTKDRVIRSWRSGAEFYCDNSLATPVWRPVDSANSSCARGICFADKMSTGGTGTYADPFVGWDTEFTTEYASDYAHIHFSAVNAERTYYAGSLEVTTADFVVTGSGKERTVWMSNGDGTTAAERALTVNTDGLGDLSVTRYANFEMYDIGFEQRRGGGSDALIPTKCSDDVSAPYARCLCDNVDECYFPDGTDASCSGGSATCDTSALIVINTNRAYMERVFVQAAEPRCNNDYNTVCDGQSTCSVTTATTCYEDADCPGGETCTPECGAGSCDYASLTEDGTAFAFGPSVLNYVYLTNVGVDGRQAGDNTWELGFDIGRDVPFNSGPITLENIYCNRCDNGVSIAAAAGSFFDTVSVRDSKFIMNGSQICEDDTYGLVIHADVRGGKIENNHFECYENGIVVFQADNLAVSGNHVSFADKGITVTGVGETRVTGLNLSENVFLGPIRKCAGGSNPYCRNQSMCDTGTCSGAASDWGCTSDSECHGISWGSRCTGAAATGDCTYDDTGVDCIYVDIFDFEDWKIEHNFQIPGNTGQYEIANCPYGSGNWVTFEDNTPGVGENEFFKNYERGTEVSDLGSVSATTFHDQAIRIGNPSVTSQDTRIDFLAQNDTGRITFSVVDGDHEVWHEFNDSVFAYNNLWARASIESLRGSLTVPGTSRLTDVVLDKLDLMRHSAPLDSTLASGVLDASETIGTCIGDHSTPGGGCSDDWDCAHCDMYCSGVTSTSCTVDADCGHCSYLASTPCTVDADCGHCSVLTDEACTADADCGHCSASLTIACTVDGDCPGAETCVTADTCTTSDTCVTTDTCEDETTTWCRWDSDCNSQCIDSSKGVCEAVGKTWVRVTSESGTADTITDIENGSVGDVLILTPLSGHTITIADTGSTPAGAVALYGNLTQDCVLSNVYESIMIMNVLVGGKDQWIHIGGSGCQYKEQHTQPVYYYRSTGIDAGDDLEKIWYAKDDWTVKGVDCYSDDATATVNVLRNAATLVNGSTCTCNGACTQSTTTTFDPGHYLTVNTLAPGSATYISVQVHLERTN